MTIETGVLVDGGGKPLFWHVPPGRNVVALPDSQTLWDVMWANRENISGFAHSHPGKGRPAPSWTDVTTFRACELALGRKLEWWITSADCLVVCTWKGPDKYDYATNVVPSREPTPSWLAELRRLSHFDEVHPG